MAKTQVEVITSVERRRRWSSAEKEQLVAASLEPGAVLSALARAAGLHPSQLYKWRRQLCARQGTTPGFTPVRIVGEPAAPGLPAPVGVIEIELAGGTRLRITGAVDAATVTAAVGALAAKRDIVADFLVRYPKVNVVAHTTDQNVDIIGENYRSSRGAPAPSP